MAVLYTVLDVLQLPEPRHSLLAFIPGAASLAALFAAGLNRDDCNLRLRRLSRPGLITLAVVTVLLLPILASSSGFTGWQWLPALVFAPASGIAQELYFRAALLPGLQRAFKGRQVPALLVHAVIFVAFHLRTFRSLPNFGIGIVVALVLFLAGCGWGWQVQKDRTVVWAMLQHSLFLILMSMFGWTG
jgi:membrane protease YdiL (CAAX protease family)